MDMKKGFEVYLGAGKRISAPSKDGNLILTVAQRRERRGKTPRKNSGYAVVLNAEKDREGDNSNYEVNTRHKERYQLS
jgi:hypothetical protein